MSQHQHAAGPPKPRATLQDDLVKKPSAIIGDEVLSDDELDALCEKMLAAMGDDVHPVSIVAKTLAQA